MSPINMPGFTAEASLYQSNTHYQVRVMLASLQQSGEVLPSFWRLDSFSEFHQFWSECDIDGCDMYMPISGQGTLYVACKHDGGCSSSFTPLP